MLSYLLRNSRKSGAAQIMRGGRYTTGTLFPSSFNLHGARFTGAGNASYTSRLMGTLHVPDDLDDEEGEFEDVDFDFDDELGAEEEGTSNFGRGDRYKQYIRPEDDVIEKDFEGKPEFDDEIEDNGGEPDPRYRLGKTLLSMGKIHYRHAEHHPNWFQSRKSEICEFRTPAQIRRCLKDWMIKYDRKESAKYRLKTLKWGHKLSSKEKPLPIHAYGPEETVAYASYFMPPRFMLLTRVLKELARLSPQFKPRRVLDFGCGPATAGAAVFDIWGRDAEKYVGVDISQSMVDAAKIMTRDTIKDCAFYTTSSEVVKCAAASGTV
jgi:hypothetical protein